MKKSKRRINQVKIWSGIVAIGVVGLIVYLIRNLYKKTPVKQNPLVISGNGGGSVNIVPVKNAYIIKTGYQSGSIFLPYASISDALDKNFEDSGFVNQDTTIYATSMDNGKTAYIDALGTTIYPAGNYFYDTNFEMLNIDVNGIMTFTGDVEKSNLNTQNINDSFQ